MPLVRVKEKYQVTIPAPVRQRVGVAVGDLLEAAVEGKKITLSPKALVDKDLSAPFRNYGHVFFGPSLDVPLPRQGERGG